MVVAAVVIGLCAVTARGWPAETRATSRSASMAFRGDLFLVRFVLRFLFHRVLTVKTPMGRKVRPKVLSQGGPLIRVKPAQLMRAGVERVPRMVGVRAGSPLLEDNRVMDVANVIWCTGFHSGFSWIDLPVLGEDRVPKHEKAEWTPASRVCILSAGPLSTRSPRR
jgi:hypothetical protein